MIRKLLERNALQYKLHGKEKVGRGPIVVCIDDSGSMRGPKEVWSRGLALALLELARKQKRDFSYCVFSYNILCKFREDTGKKTNPVELIDLILDHRGGGTNFDYPLEWSLDQVEQKESFKDSDIIFISDGACALKKPEEHKSRIKKTGARVFGIAIGPEAIHVDSKGSMKSFCEHVWPITDLRIDASHGEEDVAARGVFSI